MRGRGTAFAALIIALSASAAFASDSRHCEVSDLTGLWQTAGYVENPPGNLTETFKKFPYEYMLFGDDGAFAFIGSNQLIKGGNDAIIKKIKDQPPVASKFDVKIDNGILKINRDGKLWQGFVCGIVLEDEGSAYKKDDMVWQTPGKTPFVSRTERRL